MDNIKQWQNDAFPVTCLKFSGEVFIIWEALEVHPSFIQFVCSNQKRRMNAVNRVTDFAEVEIMIAVVAI